MIPRSKIVGVGRNYADHAAEMGNEVPVSPLLFLKPNTSVVGPDDPIVLPDWTEEVSYEAELAVVIGKVTKDVTPENALHYVFGYTVANDITARDAQRTDSQWVRAKGFDGSCPLGPWVVPGLDVEDLAVRSRVNGETKQDGRTSQLIFDVPALISYISEVMTLLPGDVILTGTRPGSGCWSRATWSRSRWRRSACCGTRCCAGADDPARVGGHRASTTTGAPWTCSPCSTP